MRIREAVMRIEDKLVNIGDLTGLNADDLIRAQHFLNNKYRHIRPVIFINEGNYLPHPAFQDFEAPFPDDDIFVEYEI